jgi:AraC-like DNA-binding protein
MSEFIRALQLPPAGRPRWQTPASATYDLLYLAWGRRAYGRHPIQTTLGIGWEYLLVVKGSPTFSLGQRAKKLQPGTFVIIPPDCPSGLRDQPDGKCEVLGWIWRTAPRAGLVGQQTEAPSFFTPDASYSKTLNQLHLRCRHEIASVNSTTPLALEILHAQLDLALLRSSAKVFATDSRARIELALRWIDQHMNERRPVSSLCAYLQVSVATLNRLFREHIGTTPHAYIFKTKLNVARLRIAQGCSVKETAFFLGYRHANELSRALKTASATA